MALTRRRFTTLSLAGLAVGALAACTAEKPSFNAIDITGASYARDFSLPDTDGKLRSIKDFQGKIVAVFFGYTQCPDACPTTMAELAEIKRQLGPDGDKLQAVFITVDPARDTPALLKAYMANFDPAFVALSTTPDTLAPLAQEFKVYYKKVDGKTDTSYTMDHSAGCYIYDTRGRIRLYTRYGTGPQPLLADIRALLKQA